MRHFMDHVQNAFSLATGWKPDSSYSALNATSDALVAFPTPRGVRLAISSLATPHFATSYQLGSVGVVDGSVSYLFSSVPLAGCLTPSSATVPLSDLHRAYRPLAELGHGTTTTTTTTTTTQPPQPSQPAQTTQPSQPAQTTQPSQPSQPTQPPLPSPTRPKIANVVVEPESKPALPSPPRYPILLYGRMYLPRSILEALMVARISRSAQLRLSAVSSPSLRNGGTMLGMGQYDVGRYALEGLASSDGGLLGLRGIYNFGGDLDDPLGPSEVNGKPCSDESATATGGGGSGGGGGGAGGGGVPVHERERIYGRFTVGAEVYYGTLNKSGGVSVGARFATLPANKGTPLTATVTINPLMGTVTATYAVVAGRSCSLATRLDFNVYSYDSCLSVGMELWKQGGGGLRDGEGGGDSLSISGEEANHPNRPDGANRQESPNSPEAGGLEGEKTEAVGRPQPGGRAPIPMRSFEAKMAWRQDPVAVAEAKPPLSSSAETMNAPSEVVRTQSDPKPDPDSRDMDKDKDTDEFSGVLKARLDQTMKIGLLWEGRVKSLLYSVGGGVDLRKLDRPFRTLGLEIQFSS